MNSDLPQSNPKFLRICQSIVESVDYNADCTVWSRMSYHRRPRGEPLDDVDAIERLGEVNEFEDDKATEPLLRGTSDDLDDDPGNFDGAPDRRVPGDDGTKGRVGFDYEALLEKAGFGRFHIWLLLVCGWANASDAIEVMCVSFLLPSAECDLKLTSADKGWLSAILFIGMLVGSYFFGVAGDLVGRRRSLIFAMLVNSLCGFASSLSQGKAVFFAWRFFGGLGVGGSIPLVWSYFGEFQPPDKRGMMLSLLATFWMVGNLSVAVVAWAIIPNQLGITTGAFLFNSWRIFVLICGIPAFTVAFLLLTLPESPKYLADKGETEASIKVLHRIFVANHRKNAQCPIDFVEAGKSEATISKNVERSGNVAKKSSAQSRAVSLNRVLTWIQDSFSNTLALFHRRIFKITINLCFTSFAIQFGYYGLWLWLPEIFNKLIEYQKEHPNDHKSVCEIVDSGFEPASTSNGNSTVDPFCLSPTPDAKVFVNSIYISLSVLPGNLWSIIHMDKLGRKFFLVMSMVTSGASAFLVYLVRSEQANLLVSCAFGLVSTMGFNALNCLMVELFPTNLRSTGLAICMVVSRMGAILGNVVFGYFLEVECSVPLVMVAAMLISGGLAGLLLPNTTRIALT